MLTGSQRKYLRGLAHGLQPKAHIGKEGLTDSVVASIDATLTARELVKVQILAERDQRAAIATELEPRLGCECVGAIGRMAILYRQQPDPERRRITLPAARG